MTKAILVLNMPENCSECPCTDYMFCYATQKELEIDWEVNKPSWCPLKPMPQKKEIDGHTITEDDCTWTEFDYEVGFNACLEEIENDSN